MAPPRKSLADHKRERTYRDDRHGDRMDGSDLVTGGIPEMPEGFTPAEQWAWNQVTSGLRPEVLASIDTMALIGLCRWWSIWREASETAVNETGKAQWTAVCQAGAAWKHVAQLAARFGMTPGDRNKFKKASDSAPTAENPIRQLMGYN